MKEYLLVDDSELQVNEDKLPSRTYLDELFDEEIAKKYNLEMQQNFDSNKKPCEK